MKLPDQPFEILKCSIEDGLFLIGDKEYHATLLRFGGLMLNKKYIKYDAHAYALCNNKVYLAHGTDNFLIDSNDMSFGKQSHDGALYTNFGRFLISVPNNYFEFSARDKSDADMAAFESRARNYNRPPFYVSVGMPYTSGFIVTQELNGHINKWLFDMKNQSVDKIADNVNRAVANICSARRHKGKNNGR